MAIDRITTQSITAGAITAAKVAADMATQAELDTKLNLAGGAMTGAITTNSTFDGIDIATRDAILTSTTTTAGAALPKAGGTMTGVLTIDQNSNSNAIDIDTESTTGKAIYVAADALTSGWIARLYSNSASTTTRNLVEIWNDNAAATGTIALQVKQDSTGVGLHIQKGTAGSETAASDANDLLIESTGNTGMTFLGWNNGTTKINFGHQNSSVTGSIIYTQSPKSMQFAVNSEERMRIDTDGKVGIGTTSPNSNFEVASTGPTIALQRSNHATSPSGSIVWVTNDNTEKLRIATNHLIGDHGFEFNIGNANKMVLSSAGNVGIGISSLSAHHTDFRSIQLGAGGSGISGGATGNRNINLSNNAYLASGGNWKYVGNDHAGNIEIYDGTIHLKVAASGNADANITWTTGMSIANNGNATFGGTVSATATATLLIINSAGSTVKTINGIG